MLNTNNQPQLAAADPDYSVWTTASAGTGKTKVLTDRVLRLLLQGTQTHKILCLTFTTAAASEMSTRINQEIAKWATYSNKELTNALTNLLGRTPLNDELLKAKDLFTNLITSIEPLRIYTIHAFCQSILNKFPLEAGLHPNFNIIDELQARSIVKDIKYNLLTATKDQELEKTWNLLAEHFHEFGIDDIIDNILTFINQFRELLLLFNNAEHYHQHLANYFNLSSTLSEQDICQKYVKQLPIQNLISIPTRSTLTDQRIINLLNEYLSFSIEQKVVNYRHISSVFLKNDGAKKDKLLSNRLSEEELELVNSLNIWQDLFYKTCEVIKKHKIVLFSKHLFILAQYIIGTYQQYKNHHGYLDYNDLIYYARKLLTDSEYKDWILYKLDGGINHLLIDEAQDTNLVQWQIIEAIISDFYTGDTKEEKRTIFIVGDDKQSIYSFQGADINGFKYMQQYIQNRMREAGQAYKIIDLIYCYRSTETITDFVYKIFEQIKQKYPNFFTLNNPQVLSTRKNEPGRVELWPLIISSNTEEYFWPLPEQKNLAIDAASTLAHTIARNIKRLLTERIILPSTGMPLNQGDIMILVRRRNNFTKQLIKTLRSYDLKVAGIDRMVLQEDMSILDIVALAQFILLPTDDLNFAELLKSPFIGLTDEQLYSIAYNRGDKSLWQHFIDNNNFHHICHKIKEWQKLYLKYDLYSFFHIIIDCLNYRQKLVEFNGASSGDIIDEFMEIVSKFARTNYGGLQDFITWFASQEIEIKREVEASSHIKIMTIHGAKGLQSGLVIMPDTTTVPSESSLFYWLNHALVVWPGKVGNQDQLLSNHQESLQESSYQEYLRLMYVAFTRAKDYLIICGYSQKSTIPDDCWYSLVKDNIIQFDQARCIDCMSQLGIEGNMVVYQSKNFTTLVDSAQVELPLDSVKQITSNNLPLTELYYISGVNKASIYSSPLSNNNSFVYGKIVHKLLEELIRGIPLELLANHSLLYQLSLAQRKKLLKKLQQLVSKNIWQDLFQGKLQSEMSITLKEKDKIYLGRIDLLVTRGEYINIIDYKTDVSPPKSFALIPQSYKSQLRNYYLAVRQIYPKHIITTQLLWLTNLKLMTVPTDFIM